MYAQLLAGITAALGNAALTGIAGAATTYSNSAIPFTLRGRAFTHAADAGVASPTVDALTGLPITLTANKARAVLWCFDSGDTARAIAGPIVDLDAAGNFLDQPTVPVPPDNLCPFHITIHKAGATTVGTWTFGSSNWNATGLSHTVINVALGMPDRPLTS